MLIPQTSSWEPKLLELAHEALESHVPAEPIRADEILLERAYVQCEVITRTHSRTFYLASSLLPGEKRKAMRALYAFCRISDDLVDDAGQEPHSALNEWRRRSLVPHPSQDDPVALAWADTRARFHIPRRYAEQLIEGVARDLDQHRYPTFDELADYCYGVASTVGLMAMHIVGFAGSQAIPYAIKLGVALQMTNILRDIGEDWEKGRLYLPQEELSAFGLDETDIASARIDERWRKFMGFQIDRNRRLYAEAAPGIAMLSPEGRFAVTAASELYQAILEDIKNHQYDVFNRRAHIGAWGKICRLPGIWRRSRS